MKTILVIDDEPVIRTILRKLFEQNGYAVIDASDGRKGMALFETENPDLVITDLIMPEEEGLEVIKKIKMIKADAKIIAISGGGVGSAQLYLMLAEKLGASYVFKKPFNVQAVLSSVQDLFNA